jgi:hypothetical protein
VQRSSVACQVGGAQQSLLLVKPEQVFCEHALILTGSTSYQEEQQTGIEQLSCVQGHMGRMKEVWRKVALQKHIYAKYAEQRGNKYRFKMKRLQGMMRD